MEKTSSTYYFSALMLMLFVSSILLPASLSAASLFCEMEMSVMNDGTLSCDAHQSEAMTSSDEASCSFEELCEQAVSDSQTSIEAVPQLIQDYAAVLFYKDISLGVLNYSKPAVFQSEPVSPKAAPPLFVLNSTFLN